MNRDRPVMVADTDGEFRLNAQLLGANRLAI
jgi:hypothetical protein